MNSRQFHERRRSFRVNDNVALSFQVLSAEELMQAIPKFSKQTNLVAVFEQEREAHLPELKVIQQFSPETVLYLQSLERKIDVLAKLLTADRLSLPGQPTHIVNISPHGIRYHTEKSMPPGARVELGIQLFPDQVCLFLYGKLVRCKESKDTLGKRYEVALEFTNIHEADQEMLAKHVHANQMKAFKKTET